MATVARGGGLLLEALDVVEQLHLALHQLPCKVCKILLRSGDRRELAEDVRGQRGGLEIAGPRQRVALHRVHHGRGAGGSLVRGSALVVPPCDARSGLHRVRSHSLSSAGVVDLLLHRVDLPLYHHRMHRGRRLTAACCSDRHGLLLASKLLAPVLEPDLYRLGRHLQLVREALAHLIGRMAHVHVKCTATATHRVSAKVIGLANAANASARWL